MNKLQLDLLLFISIVFLLALANPTISCAGVAKGEVVSAHGNIIKLNIGSDKGIKENDTGRVFYTITIDRKEKSIYVARFKITHISQNSSMAQIEEKTGEVRVGHPAEVTIKEGGLVVRAEPPGASVFINGRSVGTSPYIKSEMSPGSYTIRIVKEEYETFEKELNVEVGKTVEVTAQLKRKEPKPGDIFKDPTIGMEFVWVPGGCFEMGDLFRDIPAVEEETVHQVCVDSFWMGKYEVTQGQWERVMGSNPSQFRSGDNYPVEMVSWDDVQVFTQRLNQRSGKNYRLPTEAEWEYAARSGGRREKWAGTSSESSLGEYAWFDKNSSGRTHPVGEKLPNGLGLFDMTGNVWEWVEDWYDENYYKKSPQRNPKGPNSGIQKLFRGGCWENWW